MPRKKKSGKKNTLICSIPGIWQDIEILHDEKKLPVCKRCKKIYKTRQLCRVRDGHTALPWNTSYMCFLVDDSCLEDGRFTQSEQDKFEVEIIADDIVPKPYIADLSKLGPDPPICRQCKDKNYTRYHCRTSHCHDKLPWNTTYAVLKKVKNSSSTSSPPEEGESRSVVSTNVDIPGTPESNTCSESVSTKSTADYSKLVPESSSKRSFTASNDADPCFKKMRTDHHVFGYEDINHVSECKAFVLIMHDEGTSLHWLRTSTCTKVKSPDEVQQTTYMNHNTNEYSTCQYAYKPPHRGGSHSTIPNANEAESRELISPFRGTYGDMNALEPMPYNPHSYQDYGHNDNNSNYHTYAPNPYPRHDRHEHSQYQYNQSYSQRTPMYGYREPPSPAQKYTLDSHHNTSTEGSHGYDPHYQQSSYYNYDQNGCNYDQHGRNDYDENAAQHAHPTCGPNYYRHDAQQPWTDENAFDTRDYRHEPMKWNHKEGEKQISDGEPIYDDKDIKQGLEVDESIDRICI